MSQTNADQDFEPTHGMRIGAQLLNGQFLIQGLLRSGGFGITYIARDSLDRQVVVKECFPADLCVRMGGLVRAANPAQSAQFTAIKKQFVREARQVAKLVHPNIIAVHQVFEENNTAYMALDQVRGVDLVTLSEDTPERVTNTFIASVLTQLLSAIAYTHERGVLHRDISPDNVLVDDKGHVTLIDFGAAYEYQAPEGSRSPSIIAVKDGYSPHEFYTRSARHDESSDFYSVGATLYYLVTGDAPPSAQDRISALSDGLPDPYVPLVSGDWGIDYNILATADQALELLQDQRFTSARAWLEALEKLPKKRPAAQPKPVFDPNLEAKIANLVHTTNELMSSDSAPGMRAPQKKQVRSAEHAAPANRTVVDIFGNPIEDVAAWQAEQERETRAAETARTEAQSQETTEKTTGRTSLVTSLVSRYLPVFRIAGRAPQTSAGDN